MNSTIRVFLMAVFIAAILCLFCSPSKAASQDDLANYVATATLNERPKSDAAGLTYHAAAKLAMETNKPLVVFVGYCDYNGPIDGAITCRADSLTGYRSGEIVVAAPHEGIKWPGWKATYYHASDIKLPKKQMFGCETGKCHFTYFAECSKQECQGPATCPQNGNCKDCKVCEIGQAIRGTVSYRIENGTVYRYESGTGQTTECATCGTKSYPTEAPPGYERMPQGSGRKGLIERIRERIQERRTARSGGGSYRPAMTTVSTGGCSSCGQ